eukprot:GEMP01051987.1.p1 GENE.GEMP01051987.1~~GEMP01051987.1.p1  ORF type:complete len:179 (+),score=25.37 GEMP01051987.1:321-857(+)
MHCIDGSDWPLTMEDIQRNYVRYYRAVSYFSVTEQMLQELVWVPSYCGADAHCPDGPCKNNRCTTIKRGNCIGFREGNAVCWRLGLIGSSCSQTCGADGISTAETTKTFITPLLLPSAKLTLTSPSDRLFTLDANRTPRGRNSEPRGRIPYVVWPVRVTSIIPMNVYSARNCTPLSRH